MLCTGAVAGLRTNIQEGRCEGCVEQVYHAYHREEQDLGLIDAGDRSAYVHGNCGRHATNDE